MIRVLALLIALFVFSGDANANMLLGKKNLLDDADYTFTRASGASVNTFDRGIVQVGANERRFTGQRRVENLISSDISTWTGSGGGHTKTFGVADPFGGTGAVTLTATGANAFIEYQNSDEDYYAGGDREYSNRAWVRRAAGTGAIRMDNRGTAHDITALLADEEWHLVSTYQGASANTGGTLYHTFKIDVSGDAIDVYQPMTEEVTGQTNTNPSEFVSNGELSFPYHGAGVDGVEYFAYENNNSVVSDIITESKGVMITDTKGLLLEESRTNLATNSEGDLSTYDAKSPTGITDATTSIKGFDNSITFANPTSSTFFAYKKHTPILNEYYAFSCFVRMHDGNAPIVGAAGEAGADFSIIISGGASAERLFIEHIVDDIYRVSATRDALSTNNNFGIAKYVAQSDRTFDVVGYQIEQATFATSYIKTGATTETRQSDNLTYEFGAGNFPQQFQITMDVIPLANGVDYNASNVRFFGTDDTRGFSNELRTFTTTTPIISYQGGGLAFTVDNDNILQGVSNSYVFGVTTEGSNIRGLIQNNGQTEVYAAPAGTLDHTDTGTLDIWAYNSSYMSGYFKNIKLHSND